MDSKLRAFFREKFMVEFGHQLTEESNLFHRGIINSHGYMQILNFLEKEFSITLTDDEMFSNVLASYSSIRDLVESRYEMSMLEVPMQMAEQHV